MDSKRLILAIVLSVLIFVGWQLLAQHMGWLPQIQEQPVATGPVQPAAETPAQTSEAAAPGSLDAVAPVPDFVPTAGRLVTVDTPLYKAVFHSNGGILREFNLKTYRTTLDPQSPLVNMVSDEAAAQAPLGVLIDGKGSWLATEWALEGEDLTLDENGTGTLRFVGDMNGLRLVRELTFNGDSYTVAEKLRLAGDTPRNVNLAFTFAATSLASDKQPGILARLRHLVLGGEAPEPEENPYNITRVAWLQNDSFSEENSTSSLAKGESVKSQLHWMGVMNNYFIGAVSTNDPAAEGKARFDNGVYNARLGKAGLAVPQEGVDLECVYFIGPKEGKRLDAAPNKLGKALDYGFFSFIAKPLVLLLQFLYSYVHNYGVAILIMTIMIKIVFWPLSQKSYKSMQQMKQLQPLMLKIREKYADDKEAMNRETMQLYKTYKVNPAGGCLPILVQIPVFFGLYQALLNAIELRQAPFIETLPFTDLPWLADLSTADPFCITPLVMGATMLLQQKMTPTPGDPTQAKVMMFMPIIFTVLFLGFPSGLVVYWLVNNVISIGQQWWQLRRAA